MCVSGYSVVVPSLPGHGFTDGPSVTGVSPCVIACAYHKLMIKLGYTKYVVSYAIRSIQF